MPLDKRDRIILSALQEDASLPVHQIAERANLSAAACWKRIQKLQQDGVIRKQVCLLDNAKVGVPVTVFIAIRTRHHNVEWFQRFSSGVREMPEVIEFYRMSGHTDYLLKIVAPGIEGVDAVYKRLIQTAELDDVSSSFSMEELKYTTALPLDYA